jgi:hypothetical protein
VAGTVVFEYDPWRGGFCLHLGPFSRDRRTEAFDGLVSVYRDERGHVAAVESFWDHGGLPLQGLHQAESYPEGEFPIEGAELIVGPLQLRQTPERLELWFSTAKEVPRDHWCVQEDDCCGVTIWFSQQMAQAGWPVPGVGGRAECHLVGGLSLAFARAAATYPVSSLRVAVEDFR